MYTFLDRIYSSIFFIFFFFFFFSGSLEQARMEFSSPFSSFSYFYCRLFFFLSLSLLHQLPLCSSSSLENSYTHSDIGRETLNMLLHPTITKNSRRVYRFSRCPHTNVHKCKREISYNINCASRNSYNKSFKYSCSFISQGRSNNLGGNSMYISKQDNYGRESFLSNFCTLASTSSSISSSSVSSPDICAKDPLRIIFLGTPDVAASSLRHLLDSCKGIPEATTITTSNDNNNNNNIPIYEVVGVVSQPPAPVGRKRILTNSPVHDLTLQVNEKQVNEKQPKNKDDFLPSTDIPIFTPVKANEADFLESLQNLKPDLCITAAYGNFLPTKFLNIPKLGTINIHPSLLPKYRGASPVQRCLENGDTVTGVSILYTVLKMDAGPIIFQSNRPLAGDEKASVLLPELFADGAKVLVDTILPQLYEAKQKLYMKQRSAVNDNDIVWTDEQRFSLLSNLQEQDENMVTHADKMTKDEGLCLFSEETAESIHNKVRAFDIWPGTWGVFEIYEEKDDSNSNGNRDSNSKSQGTKENENGKRVKLITTRPIKKDSSPDSLFAMLESYMEDNDKIRSSPSSLFLLENKANKKMKHLIAGCANNTYLELVEVQLEGKKPMRGKDWWNGLRGKQVRYTQ